MHLLSNEKRRLQLIEKEETILDSISIIARFFPLAYREKAVAFMPMEWFFT